MDHCLAVCGLLLETQPVAGLFKQSRRGVRVGCELASLVEGRNGGCKIVVLYLIARSCVERFNPFAEDPLAQLLELLFEFVEDLLPAVKLDREDECLLGLCDLVMIDVVVDRVRGVVDFPCPAASLELVREAGFGGL